MSLLTESALRRAASAQDFGKTAVLLGGDSSEREISLLSGNAVLEALKRRGVDAHAFDPSDRPVQVLRSEGFARAWIALHGPGGEDGTMQGALEWIGVPYTGSGVLASALTMDKLKTKRVAVGAGYAAPDYAVLTGAADLDAALKRIGLPMMVKPASQGSSVGMTKVKAAAAIAGRVRGCARHRPDGVRRELRQRRRIHRLDPAGQCIALDPHPAGDRVLRLSGQVFPRRHAVPLPQRPVAKDEANCRPRHWPPSRSPIAPAGAASTSCATAPPANSISSRSTPRPE